MIRKPMKPLMILLLATVLATACGAPKEAAKPETINFETITFSDFKVFDHPMKSLRALAASADGQYLYTGHIPVSYTHLQKLHHQHEEADEERAGKQLAELAGDE